MAVILVVDDHQILATAVARMVQSAGNEARIATNGTEALRLLRTARFDLVVLDHHMPGMTGLEVLASLRDGEPPAHPLPPVVMFSADDNCGDDAAALGVLAFISKSDPLALLDLLERHAVTSAG